MNSGFRTNLEPMQVFGERLSWINRPQYVQLAHVQGSSGAHSDAH